MKYLVTGGCGFIGSHLCDRLIKDGHSIICLDDLSTGRASNIEHLIANPNFSLMVRDVIEPIYLLHLDGIFHLACPASPKAYQRDPIQTTRTCVLGALSVLDAAKRSQCPVVLASTSEVYGEPLEHPQRESYFGNVNPIGPRSCYDEGKRCAESLFTDYARMHDVDAKIARIFNTYGPRMQEDDGRVVSNFIMQALQDKPITIYGDGDQTRSFCYVEDMINGLMKVMDTSNGFTGPVNLGNPDEIKIRSLARNFIIPITKSRSHLEYVELPENDPLCRRPDISLAREVLGWAPTVGLENGLKLTVKYFMGLAWQRENQTA
jgi:UDP-glucuronate decarboxylase